MKSIRELAALIGTRGSVNVRADVWMIVEVDDVRVAYGETQLRVTPVAGHGYMWVNASNVRCP
jgi:hypothetical protein